MLSNPILENLKKRCDEGNAFSSAISVSSHGSGAGTLASTLLEEEDPPGRKNPPRPYSQRKNSVCSNVSTSSSSNKPSWIKEDEPAAQYFTEPSHLKKERIRNSVQEWLWELRAPQPSETKEDLSIDTLLFGAGEGGEGGSLQDSSIQEVLSFDLTKKDLLDLKSRERPSTPFPDPWETSPMVGSLSNPMEIPSDQTLTNQPTKDEISPAFQNFLNQYKNAATTSPEKSRKKESKDPLENPPGSTEPLKIIIPDGGGTSNKGDTAISASCPSNYLNLYPKIQDIKCDISARSSRSFWLEKLANYHKIIGEKVEEETERKNFESDLIGTENNPGEDSALLMTAQSNNPAEELDEDFLEADRAFDRAFLSVIMDEDENEAKSSEESSGYVGSSGNEETTKSNLVNRKRSIHRKKSIVNNINFKEDMEMLMMATKLYRQSSVGRRRRCTSTPLSSPEKPDFIKTPRLLSDILPTFSTNSIKF